MDARTCLQEKLIIFCVYHKMLNNGSFCKENLKVEYGIIEVGML